jgi:peptidoglycan/xylan/chitin deacetylase (PgdA/CDA1 family)
MKTDRLVLCYHAVSSEWKADLAVTPSQLEVQLRWLLGRRFEPTTFHDAVTTSGQGKKVAVTFDDGFKSVVERALPILKRLGFPATLFVTTRWIGSDAPMTWPGIDHWIGTGHERELLPMKWDDVLTLADAGWEIGSHTETHPLLVDLDEERLSRELVASRFECQTRVGGECLSLAYPFGRCDDRVAVAAERAGYVAACVLEERRLGSPGEVDALRWPRIGVYRGDSLARFAAKVSPLLRRISRSFPTT